MAPDSIGIDVSETLRKTSDGSSRERYAREYATRVRALTNPGLSQPIYSSDDLRGLADFLSQPYIARPPASNIRPSSGANNKASVSPFVSLYQYNQSRESFDRLDFTTISEFEGLGESVLPANESFAFLLLQGYPSSDWINTIGGRFDIDPKFFQRHLPQSLDLKSPSTRTLPSWHNNMMSLPITTVGFRQCDGNATDPYKQENLDKLRQDGSHRMQEYMSKIARLNSAEVAPGDPIFRECNVHGPNYFSLRQRLSLHFHPLRHGYGWMGIFWYDGEYQESSSLKGPWLNDAMRENSWSVKLLPASLNKPRQHGKHRKRKAKDNSVQSLAATKIELILNDYSREVDLERASIDPFYAFSPFFELSVHLEMGALGMIDAEIQEELKHSKMIDDERPTLSNLLYNQQVLKHQNREIRGLVNFMEGLAKRPWTGSTGSRGRSTFDEDTITTMLDDYRATLAHAESLIEECNQGMTIVAHNATIQESRKAMAEARGVAKLTQLAFIFIPASFVTAVFSMSVKELNINDGPSIWTWAVVVGVVWVITLLYFKRSVLRIVRKAGWTCLTICGYRKKRWSAHDTLSGE